MSAIQNMTVKVGAIIAQSTQKLMEFRGQDAQDGKLDMGALLTPQIDAISLLSHTNYELWLRRLEAIKPKRLALFFSNTGHNLVIWRRASVAAYCAIRAANRISHAAVHNSSKSSTKPLYCQKQNQLRQGPLKTSPGGNHRKPGRKSRRPAKSKKHR